jgi:exodeoxyribonuclease-5
MHVREGLPLSSFESVGAQVQLFDKTQLSTGMLTWADQILCATNNKRNEINSIVRSMKGFGPEPQIGDKIISLRNHWDDVSQFGGWALTNGAIGTITEYKRKKIWVPYRITNKSLDVMNTTFTLEDGDSFIQVPIDYKCLTTGESILTPQEEYKMRKDKQCPDPPYPFAYAYAITCHKAQGSEWSNVLVMEEGFPFSREDHKRWLYTACTRASEKLVIIKK